MKKLDFPLHDDDQALLRLENNPRLSSHPLLARNRHVIERRYDEYRAARGDAWEVGDPVKLPAKLANAMRAHYESEPEGLEFIKWIRDEGSRDVCPMCGSLGARTADHIFPKEKFPEFAIFSQNLVPACSDCNTRRGQNYRGDIRDARVLHPYFDDILTQRIAWLRFTGDFEHPLLTIATADTGNPKSNAAIKYHVDNVLEKSGLIGFATKRWPKICRYPEDVIKNVPQIGLDDKSLAQAIAKTVESEDRQYDTPNNWFSMILWGMLMSEGVVGFMRQRIIASRRDE